MARSGRPTLSLGTAGKVLTSRTDSGWTARALFRDFDGKTRLVQRAGRTEGAARQALAMALRDRVRTDGRQRINADIKVAALAEEWFLTTADLSPGTRQLYRDRLDKQIIPALGNVKVREMNVGVVDRHLTAVKAKHGPSLAKTTRSVLSGMCRLACVHNALPSNPCRDTTRISTKPKKAPMALGLAELRQLRAFLTYDDIAIKNDIPAVVDILCATGLRIGEAVALEWDAVDLAAGTVEVRGTVIRLRSEGLVIKPEPKSEAGARILQLPSWAVAMLIERKKAAKNNLVLPSELGHIRDASNTRRAMQQAFARAGYVGLTSHTFRKSVGSIMMDSGITPRMTADQLGHSQITLTMNSYMGRKTRVTGAAMALEALG